MGDSTRRDRAGIGVLPINLHHPLSAIALLDEVERPQFMHTQMTLEQRGEQRLPSASFDYHSQNCCRLVHLHRCCMSRSHLSSDGGTRYKY